MKIPKFIRIPAVCHLWELFSAQASALRTPGSARRGAALLALGTGGGQLLIVLSSPLLTRLYTPADLGVLSVYSAIVLVLLAGASLRMELAIPTAKSPGRALGLISLAIVLVGVMTATTGAAVLLVGDRFAAAIGTPALGKWLWLVPVSLFSGGSYQVFSYWAVRRRTYERIAATRFIQSAIQVVIQVGLAFVSGGAVGLLVGDTVGRALGTTTIARGIDWRGLVSRLRLRSLKAAFRSHTQYAAVMFPAAVLNLLALQLPFFLIPRAFGGSEAGYYFLAYRVLILPAALLGGAMAQVFFGETASRKQEAESLRRMTLGFASALVAVNIPLYLAFLVAGPTLFGFVFGPGWESAGDYARLLAPMVMVWSVASPLSSLLLVGNRLRESLLFTGLELGLKVAAMMIGSMYGSMPLAVILLSAFGLMLSVTSIWRFLRVAGVELRALVPPARAAALSSVPLILALAIATRSASQIAAVLAAAALVPTSWALTLRQRSRLAP